MCVIATVEAQVRSSSVGVLCVVRLRLSKAALQRGVPWNPSVSATVISRQFVVMFIQVIVDEVNHVLYLNP